MGILVNPTESIDAPAGANEVEEMDSERSKDSRKGEEISSGNTKKTRPAGSSLGVVREETEEIQMEGTEVQQLSSLQQVALQQTSTESTEQLNFNESEDLKTKSWQYRDQRHDSFDDYLDEDDYLK